MNKFLPKVYKSIFSWKMVISVIVNIIAVGVVTSIFILMPQLHVIYDIIEKQILWIILIILFMVSMTMLFLLISYNRRTKQEMEYKLINVLSKLAKDKNKENKILTTIIIARVIKNKPELTDRIINSNILKDFMMDNDRDVRNSIGEVLGNLIDNEPENLVDLLEEMLEDLQNKT